MSRKIKIITILHKKKHWKKIKNNKNKKNDETYTRMEEDF